MILNARQFNIRDENGHLLCPACGFPDYAAVPACDEAGGIVGTGLCPCCLWEPGFDDAVGASPHAQGTVLASLRVYRARWNSGPSWRGAAVARPQDWDGQVQLARLFDIASHIR